MEGMTQKRPRHALWHYAWFCDFDGRQHIISRNMPVKGINTTIANHHPECPISCILLTTNAIAGTAKINVKRNETGSA
ncbi:Uncharacterised protein [Escherichia albertii]|nr:Uncharacterised protein [Escherichia coli]